MPKNFVLLMLVTIIISLIPLFSSNEEKKGEIKEWESSNKTEKEPPMKDPFDKYNFTNIITLDDSNYTTELKKYEQIYVFFYDLWCGQCHEFIPKFIETAEYCKEAIPNLKFIRIEGSKNENASNDFSTSGFPNIFFVYKGEKYKFKGPRDKEGLLYFMKRKIYGDIIKINKLEELKNIKNVYNTSLILLSTVINGNAMINKSFKKFAKETIFMDFVSCISKECAQKYGEEIVLFKKYDENEIRYFGWFGRLQDAKIDSVKEFVGIYVAETGSYVNQMNINLASEFEKQAIFYIRNTTEDAKYDHIFKELGKELRPYNTYTFISSPDGNEIQSSIYNSFSITPDELPGIFYYNPYCNDPNNKIQLFSIRHADMKKVNVDYLKKFIKDIKNKKIKKDLYTELPSEAKKYINGMKYVIGKTYDKDVIEEKNNVLIGMIDGFGGEVEDNFIEVLGNLASKYQKDIDKKIKFNIMDINSNEPRDINAYEEDFPRIYLFTNAMNKKEMIRFTPKNMSQLTLEEVESFVIEKLNWKIEENQKNKEKTTDKKDKNEDL